MFKENVFLIYLHNSLIFVYLFMADIDNVCSSEINNFVKTRKVNRKFNIK